jgi:hypothetical protein
MKFILIFGPQAVGKMTVGHELEKMTDLKLFHNHMTIELVSPFFGYGRSSQVGMKLVDLFRKKIFEEFAKSDNFGLIFTYVWAFDDQRDWEYVKNVRKIFKAAGAEIFFVELESDEATRIKRNKTSHRLKHKPSKRNVERSEKNLRECAEKHRLNLIDGEIKEKNYVKINNTKLSPGKVAKLIKDKFGFDTTCNSPYNYQTSIKLNKLR